MYPSFPKSLRRLLLSVLLLSMGGPLFAQAPAWQDAVSPGAGIGYSTAVDAAGNTYVTGKFSGTATFGATTLTSAGEQDVFVAKRTSSGIWQWAASAGGSDDDVAVGMAVDGSGSVVITGYFASPIIPFGATTLTNAGYEDMFVAKLTPTGAWQWASSAGGADYESSAGVAVDGSGSVVITGYFTSPTITFGATTLTNARGGAADMFVAKLTPTGVWLWATGAGGTAYDTGNDLAVDGSGNVVITGFFASPTITFGTTTLTNATPPVMGTATDIFVAKLTPTGVWLWATGAGNSDPDNGNGVAVDGSGNVVVTGEFRSPTISFGATTLTNATGLANIFVAKLTPTGAWQWATGAGGNNNDVGVKVTVDGSGSVLVTGGFQGPTSSFGATTLTNAGSIDMFVAKLTPTGAWQWATGAGGNALDLGYKVALDGSGNLVVIGFFASPTIAFGATTLTNPNPGAPAIFLTRLDGITGLPETPGPVGLTLTPNPARTTVQLTGATGPTATLLDGLGRLVVTAPLTPAGTATFDLRALPAGLYLLRAGAATRRLVVE